MTPSDVAALVLSILAGLAALVSALAALVSAYRVASQVSQVGNLLNGRLDQLLAEREERVRVEALLHSARQQQATQVPRPDVGRGEPVIRPMRPEHRTEDES